MDEDTGTVLMSSSARGFLVFAQIINEDIRTVPVSSSNDNGVNHRVGAVFI